MKELLESASPLQVDAEVKEELTKIRNQFYDDLPTGGDSVFDFIEVAKEHLKRLDTFIDNFSTPKEEKQEWISVESDHFLEKGKRVLCCTSSGLMRVGFLTDAGFMMDERCKSFESYGYMVTHFRPLPAPPKQAEQNDKM